MPGRIADACKVTQAAETRQTSEFPPLFAGSSKPTPPHIVRTKAIELKDNPSR
jgi:hypothetical protein